MYMAFKRYYSYHSDFPHMKLGLQSDMFLQMQMDKNYTFQNDNKKKWFNIVSPWDAKDKEQLNRM